MAETPETPESKIYAAPSAIQTLRSIAQSHLDIIEAENTADAEQQASAMRDLQKYAKVRRKDRPKGSNLPLPESKGARLRSAQDVLHRLRHDISFRIAEYRVGYLERFEGIKEMPVTSWITESTDEEWIPQHRIKYIKHVDAEGGEDIVWDREMRVDKVFGSGTIPITDDRDESEFGGVALQ